MNNTATFLALGDSYTIGEAVPENERWPELLKVLLAEKGIAITEIDTIAKTGWTTGELLQAIDERGLTQQYTYVSLLIGVNNQYRMYDINIYTEEFEKLLNIAIAQCIDKKDVMVLSIPDWGATPFAEGKNRTAIANEIDAYNAINKAIAAKYGVHYVDVTAISRRALHDESLVADDKLHPSGKMYALWAGNVFKTIVG